MTVVTLTSVEVLHAGIEASLRISRNVAKDLPQRYGSAAGLHWTQDAESCCAEFAVAKLLNQYPSAISKVAAPDVGVNVQVRHTDRDDGHLLVHTADQGDNPEHIFVLVVGHAPQMDVRGWRYAHECQLPEYWRTDVRSPVFMVPQATLRDMSVLMDPS